MKSMKTHALRLNPEPRSLAAAAGLRYVELSRAGLCRVRSGKSFRYRTPRGSPVRDARTLDRIRKLAIPPAYRDVWICPDPKGHIQAVGKDARGRKQYRYHPKWTEATHEAKYLRVLAFAKALPSIRRITALDLRRPEMDKRKVLATVVQLLDKTLIRVGNEEYARANGSYGLSTLRNRHVEVRKSHVIFRFKGKSGVYHEIDLEDPKLAEVVRECRELPGQELFQYVDDQGGIHSIQSQDVNDYLREITHQPFTAKDFRTWAGTVLAAVALRGMEPAASTAAAKRNLNRAVEIVASKLGNTKAVCRKCYIHPKILDAYLDGRVISALRRRKHPITAKDLRLEDHEEKRVLRFLRSRL
jgi:DNA topoisomerase-1